MRAGGLPYTPLGAAAMDGGLRAALAAVQRSKGDFEGANALERDGGGDQQFYEARSCIHLKLLCEP